MKRLIFLCLLPFLAILPACDDDDDAKPMGVDPDTAEEQPVDRFSPDAGTLMIRDATNNLPEANAPVNFDQSPFITQGLGPNGGMVEYYNFDVQPPDPAPIYVPMINGESVDDQLNIIDAIPGDPGYNDFWHVHVVNVPDGFVANTITSLADIQAEGYQITETDMLVNCPVVPDGSTAAKRLGGESNGLHRGWYKGKIVYYFTFEEKVLMPVSGQVPVSPIYVAFNVNPGNPGGGPPSGFRTEVGNMQTHNVVATLPTNPGYSPLWSVNIYDNSEFNNVMDLTTAQNATRLASGAALVNCPVVSQ